jgi:hypothetical protein
MDIHILASTATKDYPQKWNEFLDWFGTEEACLAYLDDCAGVTALSARSALA